MIDLDWGNKWKAMTKLIHKLRTQVPSCSVFSQGATEVENRKLRLGWQVLSWLWLDFFFFFFCRRHTDFEVRQDKRWSPWGDALLQRWVRIQKRNLFTWGWLRLPGSREGFKSRLKSLLTPIRLISCCEHLVDSSLWKNAVRFYLSNSVAAKSQITQ